jgi:hypothetical protein
VSFVVKKQHKILVDNHIRIRYNMCIVNEQEQIVLMKVYASRKLNLMYELTPIVIETNLAWAIPYWTERKRKNPKLFWEIV